MSKSTLFFNNLTVIDHSYIDNDGRIHGRSLNASFELTGDIKNKEQVVIDFGTAKKLIKRFVDGNITGVDHKLWVFKDYVEDNGGHHILVATQMLKMVLPRDAVWVTDVVLDDTKWDEMEKLIGENVQTQLREYGGMEDVEIKCFLDEQIAPLRANLYLHAPFNYVHGLKNSSSYGCQNLAHGHTSFLQIFVDKHYRSDCSDCANAIKLILAKLTDWKDSIFIFKDNIISETDEYIEIEYFTDRGRFYAKYYKAWCKFIVFEKETTIENLVENFVSDLKYFCEMGHIEAIALSEGLCKGALVEMNYE